jgi:hypothetical protein
MVKTTQCVSLLLRDAGRGPLPRTPVCGRRSPTHHICPCMSPVLTSVGPELTRCHDRHRHCGDTMFIISTRGAVGSGYSTKASGRSKDRGGNRGRGPRGRRWWRKADYTIYNYTRAGVLVGSSREGPPPEGVGVARVGYGNRKTERHRRGTDRQQLYNM